MPPASIRVAVVEDKDDFRGHLVALIQGAQGFCCTGAHATAESALKQLAWEKPEVLLLDLELPKLSGEDSIREFKARLPALEILVLTLHDEPKRIFTALEAGASGYLIKPVHPAKLLEAIAEVRAGGSPMSSQIARLVVRVFHQRGRTNAQFETLTTREEEILKLLADGGQTKEIADSLKISARTVSTHLHHIYDKLHVGSRSQAVARFLQR